MLGVGLGARVAGMDRQWLAPGEVGADFGQMGGGVHAQSRNQRRF